MNREEAKSLLVACRPNGADARAPHLVEALALLEQDVELRAWFEAEQAADAAIAAKLKAGPLPEDLLEQIRAGTQARIARQPRQHSFALAMAAIFMLLGLLAILWLNRAPAEAPGSFAAYRTDMAQFLREFPKLDIATDRLPEVREWLEQQHPLTKVNFPKALEKFPSIGCRTVNWQRKKLALVCFMVEGQVVHLFVLPRNTFPDAGDHSKPLIAKVGSQNTASWSGSDNQYFLVTQADKQLLEKLF